jgi:hypothetical protein
MENGSGFHRRKTKSIDLGRLHFRFSVLVRFIGKLSCAQANVCGSTPDWRPQTKERTMKFKTMTLLPLVLAAAFTTAAEANYFANPRLNVSSNVGSAPSPRPVDVRENREPQVSENSFTAVKVGNSANEAQNDQTATQSVAPASGWRRLAVSLGLSK